MTLMTNSNEHVTEISHRPLDDGAMEVTYRIAPGRYATVSVPYASWLQGHHAAAPAAIREMLAELQLQSDRVAASIPE